MLGVDWEQIDLGPSAGAGLPGPNPYFHGVVAKANAGAPNLDRTRCGPCGGPQSRNRAASRQREGVTVVHLGGHGS